MGRQTSAGWVKLSSKICQYYSPDGADSCSITSHKPLTCLQLVFKSNWSNFRHAFASRGFVSDGLSATAGLSCTSSVCSACFFCHDWYSDYYKTHVDDHQLLCCVVFCSMHGDKWTWLMDWFDLNLTMTNCCCRSISTLVSWQPMRVSTRSCWWHLIATWPLFIQSALLAGELFAKRPLSWPSHG